jgi:hypothetical protein
MGIGSGLTGGRLLASPLLHGGGIPAAAAPVTTLTYRLGANAASATCSLPTGSLENELCIGAWAATNSSGLPDDVVPPDWVVAFNYGVAPRRRVLMVGILTAADVLAGSITGPSGDSINRSVLITLTPDELISALAWHDVSSEFAGTGDPVAQEITASAGAVPLVVCGLYSSGSVINPRTWTGGTPVENSNAGRQYLNHEVFNASPADITIDMDNESAADFWGGAYLEVS